MGFNLGKYIKGSAKDAFSRMSEDVSNQFRDAAINSVTKTFSSALKKVGFSNSVTSTLTSKLSDAAQAELAEKFFNKANPEINRIPAANGEGVRQNRYTMKAETSTEFSRKAGKSLMGVNEVLAYPSERGYYYTKIEFFDYKRPNAQDNAKLEVIDAIYLPLPAGSNLTERQGIKIATPDLGMGGAVGDLFAAGKMDSGDAAGIAQTAVERIVQNVGNAAIDGGGDAIKNFMQMAFGYTANPHTAVMFQGVDLRQHQFNWRLSPETPNESVRAQKIADKLRFNSLPTFFSDTTALFNYPMICKVSFHYGPAVSKDQEPPKILYTTKYCMVRDVSINYAPNGVPSFFVDTNAPTSMEIGIQLQEIEYFTAADHADRDLKGEDINRRLESVTRLNPLSDYYESQKDKPTEPEPEPPNFGKQINGAYPKSDFEYFMTKGSEGGSGPKSKIDRGDGTFQEVNSFRIPTSSRKTISGVLDENSVKKDVTLSGPGYYAEVRTIDKDGTSLGKVLISDNGKPYPNTNAGRAAFLKAMQDASYVKK